MRIVWLHNLCAYYETVQMSEFEPIPDLVRTLQLTHEGLGDLTRNQAEQLGRLAIETQTPVVYSGRYLQSYRSAVDQRRAAIEALRVAERRELESKRTVDALAAAVSSPSATASSAVPPSEDLLNQAKLDLARSEDGFEAAKETEGAVTGRLRSECQLLESSQTRRILVLRRRVAFACHCASHAFVCCCRTTWWTSRGPAQRAATPTRCTGRPCATC